MKSMIEWQAIDSAPRDGTKILAYSPSWGIVVTWWTRGFAGSPPMIDGWREEDDDGMDRVFRDYPGLEPEVPTHWMPLPDKPTIGTSRP